MTVPLVGSEKKRAKSRWQRRFERWIVQYQARLEAGAGDRWIPGLISLMLASSLTYFSLAGLQARTNGETLAGYVQAVWLIGEGRAPEPSLFGTGIHVLELHWSFILYLLALPGLVFPIAPLLVALQALGLGVAVVPLWRLARNVAGLRVGAASALIAAYALHPTVHRLALEDFHPVTLAVPGLMAMTYFGARQRWVLFWICVAFVLLCRADLGLAVAFWGLIVIGRSDGRVGLWAVGVGLVWSLAFLLVAQPLMGQPGRFGGYAGQSTAEVVLFAVQEPGGMAQNLVAEENVSLLIGLLTPVLFLPLLSLRHFIPGLAAAMFSLSIEDPLLITDNERSAVLLVFALVASTFALRRLGNMGVSRVFVDARLLIALFVVAALLFVNSSPLSVYGSPPVWAEKAEGDALLEATALISSTKVVRASPSALPVLAERREIYSLNVTKNLSVTETAFPEQVTAVLVVESDLDTEQNFDQRLSFDDGMESLGFEVQEFGEDNEIRLYLR